MEYKCPYCNQDSYAKSSKKKGKFESWESVRHHVSKCKANTGIYFIDLTAGIITINNIPNNCKSAKTDIIKSIKKHNPLSSDYKNPLTDSDNYLLSQIKYFVSIYKRTPTAREFKYIDKYSSPETFIKHFGSWNKAIELAGFTPRVHTPNIRILSLDNTECKSNLEAYFIDTYLYNKYEYVYEPSYDDKSNRKYDFYLPELDLYIEIDGKLRPSSIINDKKETNQKLNRNVVYITSLEIYKHLELKELCGNVRELA